MKTNHSNRRSQAVLRRFFDKKFLFYWQFSTYMSKNKFYLFIYYYILTIFLCRILSVFSGSCIFGNFWKQNSLKF